MSKTLSEFFRNSTEEEKRKVFDRVIDRACEQQLKTHEALLVQLEDLELARLVEERKNQKEIPVDFDDL